MDMPAQDGLKQGFGPQPLDKLGRHGIRLLLNRPSALIAFHQGIRHTAQECAATALTFKTAAEESR